MFIKMLIKAFCLSFIELLFECNRKSVVQNYFLYFINDIYNLFIQLIIAYAKIIVTYFYAARYILYVFKAA